MTLTECSGVTDAEGRTPLDLAIQEGHTLTTDYLQSVGAPSSALSQSTNISPVDQQPQGILVVEQAIKDYVYIIMAVLSASILLYCFFSVQDCRTSYEHECYGTYLKQ